MNSKTFSKPSIAGTSLPEDAATRYLGALGSSVARFDGMRDKRSLLPGLQLRRHDCRDLQGAPWWTQESAGLHLLLTLTGGADLSVDGQMLARRPGLAGHALIWGAGQMYRLQRQSRRGDIDRSVLISLAPAWLQSRLPDTHPLRQAGAGHLDLRRHALTRPSLAVLQQLLQPPRQDDDLLPLYLESRVLELLHQVAQGLRETAGVKLSRRKFLRMAQVREELESGMADHWSLAEIAARHHLSVNTLQRHFRAAWDASVDEYRRDARLRRARCALEREGLSVAQAAEIAGYSSPANFATAFRRAFGMAPSQAARAALKN
ncbi:enterobactin-dependent positive regulator [Bordetella trematum]|uniref:Enterobactin-dependent positive regulator n=1 Tax=Bordetella trematum TaxID=123899 RepID=A0A157SQG5_9BORD|nr:AraC family transcriptional regulator [Bordetella trematum]SAH81251.1 enterobactin-dependent positive regulator [Bordetella trematum]SAI72541.1 enterobactin-dependent positive regulator [Bordetella trematum]SUV97782.1 enterobactin-dependent positive regulator [Bordetella trematum]